MNDLVKIRMLRDDVASAYLGALYLGKIVNVPPDKAEQYIKNGWAELVEEAAAPDATEVISKPARGRKKKNV